MPPTKFLRPEQLLAVITGKRRLKYPFEDVVAFLTFCGWMRWPHENDLVLAAHLAAKASVIVWQKDHKKRVTVPTTIYELSNAIVRDSIPHKYRAAFGDLDNSITEIVGFFMHCPEELKPSLLKARYFINNGGFVPEGIEKAELNFYKDGATTLKSVWKSQAISGPFLWAAYSEDALEILSFYPDDPDCVPLAAKFIRDKDRLENYLGIARYCQERLIRLLNPDSASRFNFVKIPNSIRSVEPDIEMFDDAQLSILKGYAAPSFVKPREVKSI